MTWGLVEGVGKGVVVGVFKSIFFLADDGNLLEEKRGLVMYTSFSMWCVIWGCECLLLFGLLIAEW